MTTIPKPVQKLIDEFSKLPGIGPKTAGRLTFYLLKRPKDEVRQFSTVLDDMTHDLVFCERCGNIAESSPCSICDNDQRSTGKIAVVEEPLDVLALEKSGFRGRYHVLGGVISPAEGISPEDLRIKPLIQRLSTEQVEELILATNPTLEGEATAMYVAQEVARAKEEGTIKEKPVLTRIARGLPMGGDLEYVDEVTLERAMENRKEF